MLGPTFARQDGFRRQVRMPEPPLLLCDRVMSIDAEPGVLTTKRCIRTETDVRWDSYYLHEGRVTPGVLIEAGQADLLLISWMGVDFENQGERVYRLLGCDLTYTGALPPAGSLLHYDIHVDGFATHGATRIFFFHSDCRVGGPDGEVVLQVRNGQAGFFTDAELAQSGGVLWTPADVKQTGDVAAGPRPTTKRALTKDDLTALTRGDVAKAFGAGFEIGKTHVRSPRLQGKSPVVDASTRGLEIDFLFLDRVTELDPAGGPWGKGYLRAELELDASKWFYQGHFKDDPCMPGTMMFQGCLQTLEVYLASQGFTLDRDGWRFEPVHGSEFPLRCRGQATPSSQLLVYEVFVKELIAGPLPTIRADILVTVDGLKSLHCKDAALRLVPDAPLSSRPDLTGGAAKTSGEDAVGGVGNDAPALQGRCAFDQTALLATGIGTPTQAFGPMYARFDGGRRIPRLPGPPYHFMSRVVTVDGPPQGVMQAGGTAVVDYDVPPDAWFFDASRSERMPFAVLLEAALQPCGWLSSYVGSALVSDNDLFYRNLDGKGVVHREIGRGVGTITTTAKLEKISRAGDMIIQDFTLQTSDRDGPLFTGSTVFGFFPGEALAKQVGVGSTDADRKRLVEPLGRTVDLRAQAFAQQPGDMLRMIDVVHHTADLARARTEKRVDLDEWFFKAHFFQDPVQPGSLGIEAMLQALCFLARERGLQGRLQSLATGAPLVWKYRGQVVPKNELIVTDVEVTEVRDEGSSTLVVGKGSLWVDGLRIYAAEGLSLRLVRS